MFHTANQTDLCQEESHLCVRYSFHYQCDAYSSKSGAEKWDEMRVDPQISLRLDYSDNLVDSSVIAW